MKFKVSGGRLGNNVIESGSSTSTNSVGIITAKIVDVEEKVEEKKEIPSVNVTVKDERPKNKEVEEAVEFDPSLIKKDKKDENALFNVLSKAIDSFKENYSDENSENKRSINGLIVSLLNELVNSFESEEDASVNEISVALSMLGELYIKLYNIFEQKADEEDADPEELVNFPIDNASVTFQKNLLYNIFKDSNFKLAIETDHSNQTFSPIIYFDIPGVERNNPLFNPIYGEAYDIGVLAADYIELNRIEEINNKPIEEIMSEAEDLLEASEDSIDDLAEYSDIAEFAAEIINVKDVLPEKDPKKVMAIVDEDGEYITIGNNQLLVIDRIDNRELNKLTLVSKSWFNEITSDGNVKEIPTGVVPENADVDNTSTTTFSVNGVGDNEE